MPWTPSGRLTNPDVGALTDLTTATKSTLVAAVNEVKAVADAASGGGLIALSESEWAAIAPGIDGIVYVVFPDAEEEPPAFAWMISDDFAATETPPATTDTGQAWRIESGTWNQASGNLTAAADGAIAVVPVGSITQTVEFTLGGTLVGSSYPTAVMRYDNANDYHYRVTINNGTIFIYRRDPSQTTIWQSAAGLVTSGARVRLAVSGAAGAALFRVWVNDVEITSGVSGSLTDTDATPPLGTEAGFRYAYTSTGNGYQYCAFRAHNAVVVP